MDQLKILDVYPKNIRDIKKAIILRKVLDYTFIKRNGFKTWREMINGYKGYKFDGPTKDT